MQETRIPTTSPPAALAAASAPPSTTTVATQAAEQTAFTILLAISLAHLLNDTIQATIPSLYPLLKENLALSYTQLGLITLTFQCTASIMQPLVGHWADKHPRPYSLMAGMGMTLGGLLLLSVAHTYPMVIISAALVGLGSAVFHPEASRVAYTAAGRRRGLAQSIFQVGGNAGSSLGPLLVMTVVLPRGQAHVAWFSLLAGLGMLVLWHVGGWMSERLRARQAAGSKKNANLTTGRHLSRGTVVWSMVVLIALTFSKYVYLASMTSYYTFYLMERFHVSMHESQLYLFVFLAAVALGTVAGGPLGDMLGRKKVIWVSILGVAPFSLWLPHAGLHLTAVLTVVIGMVLASAFSAILVYAQELIPGKVGLIAGLFFGLAFGIAGIGSAVLGKVADLHGIVTVYHYCAYLPLIGLFTAFLPDLKQTE